MNYNDEQLADMFEQFPETVQGYLQTDEVLNNLDDVTEQYNIERPENFRRYVVYVALGLWNIDEFQKNVADEYELSADVLTGITIDLDTLIWHHVRELVDAAGEPKAPSEIELEETMPEPTEKEALPSKTTLITNLEKPETIKPASPVSFLDAKLKNQTQLPKEEVHIEAKPKSSYVGSDPYREPPTP